MPKLNRISRNNTVILPRPDGSVGVVLHGTEVVRKYPDRVVFNTGGWYTATTRTRMIQVCREWGLPFTVSMAKGQTGVHDTLTWAFTPFDATGLAVVYLPAKGSA